MSIRSLILATFLAAGVAFGQFGQFGSDVPSAGPDGSTLHMALLQNNSDSRLLDKDGYQKGELKALGRVVNPSEVLIIAFPWAPDSAVSLYTRIPKLPDHVAAIRVLYYASKDRKSAMFMGYTIEAPYGTTVTTVHYPTPAVRFEEKDASAWLKWILASLEAQKPPVTQKKNQ